MQPGPALLEDRLVADELASAVNKTPQTVEVASVLSNVRTSLLLDSADNACKARADDVRGESEL
jgi:hypothetical protein